MLISIYALYKGGTFDPVLWGAGLAALMGAGGASLGLKGATEPEAFSIQTPNGTKFKQSIGKASTGDDSDDSDGDPPPPAH